MIIILNISCLWTSLRLKYYSSRSHVADRLSKFGCQLDHDVVMTSGVWHAYARHSFLAVMRKLDYVKKEINNGNSEMKD
jgi:hypothetical protein